MLTRPIYVGEEIHHAARYIFPYSLSFYFNKCTDAQHRFMGEELLE